MEKRHTPAGFKQQSGPLVPLVPMATACFLDVVGLRCPYLESVTPPYLQNTRVLEDWLEVAHLVVVLRGTNTMVHVACAAFAHPLSIRQTRLMLQARRTGSDVVGPALRYTVLGLA